MKSHQKGQILKRNWFYIMGRYLTLVGILILFSNCSNDVSVPETSFNATIENDVSMEVELLNFNAYVRSETHSTTGYKTISSRISVYSEDLNTLFEQVFYLDEMIDEKSITISSPHNSNSWSFLKTTVAGDTVSFYSEEGNLNIKEYSNEFIIGDFDVTYRSQSPDSNLFINVDGGFVIRF
jgi:hypothetical protein